MFQISAAFEDNYPHKTAVTCFSCKHRHKVFTQTENSLCMRSVPERSSSLCCLQQEITAPQSFMTAANIWLTECDGNHCLRWFTNPSATAGNSQYHRAYYLINTALYLYYFTEKIQITTAKHLKSCRRHGYPSLCLQQVSKCEIFWPSYLPVFLHKDRQDTP